jgi:pentatricopeptide repeat protein
LAFGEIRFAGNIFEEFREPDVFLWNAIIRGDSRHNMFGDTVEMYLRMQVARVSPGRFTSPSVKACCGLPALRMGCRV